MLPQCRELGDDTCQSRWQIPHHQGGLQPEDSIPETPEHFVTSGIGPAAASMAFAVNLDDQLDFGSQEIGDVPAGNRHLAAELDAELLGANGFPDPPLEMVAPARKARARAASTDGETGEPLGQERRRMGSLLGPA